MVLVAVAASAAVSVAGSAMSASAARDAASTEAAASDRAAALQQAQQAQTRADLLPYNTTGQANLLALQDQYKNTKDTLGTAYDSAQAAADRLGTSTQAQLEATPGYQFSLSQGLQATQANAAARGLGVSGAAMKGASNFATGLANNTYQNVFNQQQQQFSNASQQFSNQYNAQNAIYNQLMGPANLGENAAAQTGAQGTMAASNAGTNIANAGQQTGAGITTSANNLASGLNNASGLGYLYAMQNKGGGGATTYGTPSQGYLTPGSSTIVPYDGSAPIGG